ncbi:MAG: hypothetical protein U5O15_10040 [Candidatus Krumholzibacteriota bacterium]|nr:hypothetical protein [Candidatus Krumholzibacteriota bacterium]
MVRKGFLLAVSMVISFTLIPQMASAKPRNNNEDWMGKLKEIEKIWVLDGSGIHNVGNLQLHVTNWGCFGSYPGSNFPTGDYPSAQWPANSGVEYLYIAGLWVGAKKGGLAAVSTAAYQQEFRPPGVSSPDGDIAIIYEANSSKVGGSRFPRPADDDKDGLIDEDPLDGKDNDGDGKIDEDFAGIGSQMFSTWYMDDEETATSLYPDHVPLGLYVHQESYQWEDEDYMNFVGIDYQIIHYQGTTSLDNVYVGFFADGDAGDLETDNYWQDDCTGRYNGVVCTKKGNTPYPVIVDAAYFYDKDTDEGAVTGYLGIVFLGHKTDPTGFTAPKVVGLTSYQAFSGDQPFEDGGDPSKDSERYQLMSANQKDKNQDVPRDYRMLMATGPFDALMPGDTLSLQVAVAVGPGLSGLLTEAASAVVTYEGNWFDLDTDPETGINGRETRLPGPVTIDPDTCDADDSETVSAGKDGYVWVNMDCGKEDWLYEEGQRLGCSSGNKEDYMTGTRSKSGNGREAQIKWLVGTAPPPPGMRIVPGHNKTTLYWDNFSEEALDVSTLEKDFAGFRVWRADGWNRPVGTTESSGPSKELWKLILERDYAGDGYGQDREYRMPYSEGGLIYEPLQDLGNKEKLITMFEENLYYFPLDPVPCPPGLSQVECDTLESLARYNLNFNGGKRYYKYVDAEVTNGQYYFYSVTAFDYTDKYGEPTSNFILTSPVSKFGTGENTEGDEIFVVPNPVTKESVEPWKLGKNMDDPSGIKIEFRRLPHCPNTIRIYTLAGDLVETILHKGESGTATWDLISRNGQEITSGIYLYSVEPENTNYDTFVGKFVVIK